jgi:hypothetical protein
MAQGVDPEFKPQHHKEKKEKESILVIFGLPANYPFSLGFFICLLDNPNSCKVLCNSCKVLCSCAYFLIFTSYFVWNSLKKLFSIF